MSQKFGHMPTKPFPVVLHTNQPFATEADTPALADNLFDDATGTIHIPTAGALEDLGLLSRVVRHQFAHALIHEKLGTQKQAVPIWLAEGLSLHLAEDPWPALDEAKDHPLTVLPLQSLQGHWQSLPKESITIAYQEATLATQHLLDRYNMYGVRQVLTTLIPQLKVFPDKRLNAITVKAKPNELTVANRIVNQLDKAKPEVMVYLELMEVTESSLEQVGLLPVISLQDAASGTGVYRLGATLDGNLNLPNQNKGAIRISKSDLKFLFPSLALDALKNSGDAKLVASPNVRVISGEKGEVNIGEKISTTQSSIGGIGGVGGATAGQIGGLGSSVLTGATQTQFSYEDVGVKITVELAAPSPDTLWVRVRDRGVGIPRRQLRRIFNRFHRFQARGLTVKGTGLGLYIVRSIARQHGGRVFAESRGEGQGATFTLELPKLSRGAASCSAIHRPTTMPTAPQTMVAVTNLRTVASSYRMVSFDIGPAYVCSTNSPGMLDIGCTMPPFMVESWVSRCVSSMMRAPSVPMNSIQVEEKFG